MSINVTNAAAAYANAGRMATGTGMAPREAGGGFADLLKKSAEGVIDTLQKGEQATLQAVAGKADLTEVTAAVSNAEAALQTVVAVRDRVIQAYQDILRMPI
jgi:flagellar hook-basal body complex protein FliE